MVLAGWRKSTVRALAAAGRPDFMWLRKLAAPCQHFLPAGGRSFARYGTSLLRATIVLPEIKEMDPLAMVCGTDRRREPGGAFFLNVWRNG